VIAHEPDTIKKPANWFSGMSVRERRTFWACFSAWALNAMDVQSYVVVMPTLIGLWGLSGRQAGVLATSALLTSSVGGWTAGILADRFGRVKVLRITIIWFAICAFLSGFTNSYHQLLVTRSLQGLGFGGEWAAGAVLVGEVVDRRIRGRAAGTVQSGWSIGYGAAVLLFTVIFSLAPPAQAWRILFYVAFVPAFLVFWVCRRVQEPEVFREWQQTQLSSPRTSHFLEIFKPSLLPTTLIASLLAAGALGGSYSILTWLPTYLKTVRRLSVLDMSGFLAITIAGSFCGYIVSAHLSDWIGRRLTFAIVSIAAAATIALLAFGSMGTGVLLLLGFPLGFFKSGLVAGMSATFVELFPTRVRAGGQGFTYNAGRGIGSLMPALIGYLSSEGLELRHAIGVCAICSYALVLLMTVFLRETRGKALDASG
jgi:MFS family permease